MERSIGTYRPKELEERDFSNSISETLGAVREKRKAEGKFKPSLDAENFVRRVLEFLVSESGTVDASQPTSTAKLKDMAECLIGAFDSGELHELFSQDEISKEKGPIFIGNVFEILSKYDPKNPLNNIDDRDPESESVLLTLMSNSELIPTDITSETRSRDDEVDDEKNREFGQEQMPRNLAFAERKYDYVQPEKGISQPDDLAIVDGKIVGLMESKTTTQEAKKSDHQLNNFYDNLKDALYGTKRHPGINHAVLALRADFSLRLPEGGFKLDVEEKIEKYLFFPAGNIEDDYKPPKGFKVAESTFSYQELGNLAFGFMLKEGGLPGKKFVKRFERVEFLSETQVA